jgi:hypothetical protein
MKKDYFQYPVPLSYELRELYKSPYKFSDELREYVNYMFTHPYNKYNKLYHNLHTEWDSNDMLKPAYLMAMHYMKYPQRYGHAMDNIADTMLVRMWKQFLHLHKHLRGVQFSSYMPTKMKMLTIGNGLFLEKLIDEINSGVIIMSSDDMIKKREGKGLRESAHASMKEGGREFEYLCSLD